MTLQSNPEQRVQNHAEFVSIQTVNALAHNGRIAVRRIDTGDSLVEILAIDPIYPAGTLQNALVLQDEVWPDFSPRRAYR